MVCRARIQRRDEVVVEGVEPLEGRARLDRTWSSRSASSHYVEQAHRVRPMGGGIGTGFHQPSLGVLPDQRRQLVAGCGVPRSMGRPPAHEAGRDEPFEIVAEVRPQRGEPVRDRPTGVRLEVVQAERAAKDGGAGDTAGWASDGQLVDAPGDRRLDPDELAAEAVHARDAAAAPASIGATSSMASGRPSRR